MTAVLVTGGTGFIGQHLVRTLRTRGQHVRVLVRPSHDAQRQAAARRLAAMGAELIEGDILDSAAVRHALENVSSVFHLAGQLLVPGVTSEIYRRLHVEGTQTLLSACAELSLIERVVHCSTTGVLGPTGHTALSEDAPLRPSTIYEYTKAMGEQSALDMANKLDLPLTVVRPALVYGPGDRHLLGWFRAIERRYFHVVGSGATLLHPIYIADLIEGMLRCADIPTAARRIYHLVGEQALPIRDFAATIAHALGTQLPRLHLSVPLAWSVASILEALPGITPRFLPLTRSRVAFMIEDRVYSGSRARDELGFTPCVPLQEGVRRAVAWYRREKLL